MRRLACGLAALLALAACGNAPREVSPGVEVLRSLRNSLPGKSAPAQNLVLDRAALAQIPTPVQLVTVTRTGQRALVGQTGTNRGVETWASNDDVSISLRDGVLVATRGFGADLMVASVPDSAALRRAGSSHRRQHGYLTGLDAQITRDFACEVRAIGQETVEIAGKTFQTSHLREDCRDSGSRFSNDYWFAAGGALVKSQQMISPTGGFLIIEDLRR